MPIPYTRKDAEEFVNVITPAGWAADTSYTWAICDPLAESLLGVMSLDAVRAGRADVGYWLAAEGRGRGVATRALAEVCRFGLQTIGLDVLHWEAITGNEASRRVAERLGFHVTGPVRGLIHQRGQWRDGWVGSLTAQDRRMPEPAVLADGVLALRPWQGGDFGGLADLVDDEVVRWTAVEGHSPRQLAAWLDESRRPRRPPGASFAVTDDMATVLGHVGLHEHPVTREITLECWLGSPARGMGHAERALRLAMYWAVEKHAPRLTASIEPDNAAAIRLVERLGMHREGLRRAYWPAIPREKSWQPEGPRRDCWLYSLVPGDAGWPQVDRRPRWER